MSDLIDTPSYDCLIVGGGPAGLTAAIYLARFHLGIVVIDDGASRALQIPLTRNHAGFPEGISGAALLERMQRQAGIYGAEFRRDRVTAITRTKSGFSVRTEQMTAHAKTVLLATGVVNRRPDFLDDETHDRALAAGLVRYCPICDGYEMTDRRLAVLGTGERGTKEALFLRSYTAQITLVAPAGGHQLSPSQRDALTEAGIALSGPCRAAALQAKTIDLDIEGIFTAFDSLYPALGSDIRSELAEQLEARRSGDECLVVDAHQRTTIAGFYAAGDVVLGLDQISHAMGEGGVAATTIRNDLAQQAPLRR